MLRFLFFLLVFFPVALLSQIPDSSKKDFLPAGLPPPKVTPDSLGESGVFLTNRDGGNAPNNFVVANAIHIEGNKVTKKHIILREIPFSVGDTIQRISLQKNLTSTKENLLNTSLFNFVTIDTSSTPDGKMNFIVTVTERWYTWPVPIFEIQERNFNVWWETKNLKRVNYGFLLNRENFRGRKEEVNLLVRFGYTERYGIAYNIPYLNNKQTLGMGTSFSYTRNKEIAYATFDNKLVYHKDEDNYVRNELSARITLNYRKGIYNTQTFEVKFNSVNIADTVMLLTNDYLNSNKTKLEFFTLYYAFVRDHRDSKAYPLKGYYLDFEMVNHGFGILEHEDLNVFFIFSSVRKYWKLSEKVFLSGALKGKVSSTDRQPYYVQRGLGYKDYVRAFEYYVIDGQQYGMFKSSIKYQIIKPREKIIPLIPSAKFSKFHYALYGGIFGDAGYVKDTKYYNVNPLSNQLLYAGGAGIDFVSYYDTVFRMEYAVNHLGEHGFFIHFSKAF